MWTTVLSVGIATLAAVCIPLLVQTTVPFSRRSTAR